MRIGIEVLKASYGDCILISIVQDGLPYIIMIDGGTGDTYTYKNKKGKRAAGALKDKLEQLRREGKHIDLLIITHVDNDHIGGIINWFEDEIPTNSFVKCIWLNDDTEIKEEKSLDNTAGQAASMKRTLESHAIKNVDTIVAGKVFAFDWGKIFILSPTIAQHNIIAGNIAKELNNSTSNRYGENIEDLLKEEYKGGDSSPENNASIAFLLQMNGSENVLMLGDANITTVMNSLKSIEGVELPLHCSWVKLSHHGSKNNFKPELLNMITADNYIISTNGMHFGHPDKEVVAWLVGKTDSFLWFNYRERAENIFTAKDIEQYPNLIERIKSF